MLATLSPCSPWTGGVVGRDLGQRPATPPSGQGARCAKRANPGCKKAPGQPDSPRPHPHARPAGPAPGCLEGASPDQPPALRALLIRGAVLSARPSPCAPARRAQCPAVHTHADTQPASLAQHGHLNTPGCLSSASPGTPARAPTCCHPPRPRWGCPAPFPGEYAGCAYSPQELDLVLALAPIGHGSSLLARPLPSSRSPVPLALPPLLLLLPLRPLLS